MTKETLAEWLKHVDVLRRHVEYYYRYDRGYIYQQKKKFGKELEQAIDQIKRDFLDRSPFAVIAYQVTHCKFCFNECYDSMGRKMEQTKIDF